MTFYFAFCMSLSLYFLFCIWGFGTVALMGNKSCYSTSLNFPPGHLKANMGKVFPLYQILISKEDLYFILKLTSLTACQSGVERRS